MLLSCVTARAQCPGLDFSASKLRACIFDPIEFYPVNVPPGSQVEWVVGVDTVPATDTLNWIFNRTGVFDVELIVTSGGTPCKVRKNRMVTIGTPVINPPIHVPSKIVCSLDDSLRISNNTPNALYRSWSIGSRYYPDTSATIYHSFTSPGYYRINLKLVDSNGCVALNSLDSILVLETPSLVINPSDTGLCTADVVDFSFSSSPNRVYSNILWGLPGGSPSTSTATAPTGIVYSNTGSYNVSLEVTDTLGCAYKIQEDSLINVGTRHILDMQLSSHYVCTQEKLSVHSNFSGLDPRNLAWTLPGASIDRGSSQPDSQVFSYGSGGKKAVGLQYSDNGCMSDTADTVHVVVLAANFEADKTCGCKVPLNVNFNPNSTNYKGSGTLAFAWNFYDGNNGTALDSSTQRNPSFNFPIMGMHDVQLTVSDGLGCTKSIRKNDFIRIDSLKATISASPATVCPGQHVTFSTKADSTCQNGLASFSWRFYDLDGTTLLGTSSLDKPIFAYNNLSEYPVSLAITNQEGCSDSVMVPGVVTVGNLDVDFFAEDTIMCSGSGTRFHIVDSSGIPATANWTITETSTGNVVANTSEKSPKVLFPDPGTYTVKLMVQVPGSCADSVVRTGYIRVNGISANITAADTGGCLPFSTTLQANITNRNIGGNAGNVTINWIRSGSGSPLTYGNDTATTTSASISETGCYDVKLQVSNSAGCTFTDDRTAFLCAGVTARFTAPPHGCLEEGLELVNTSSVNAKTFAWASSRSEGRFLPNDSAKNPVFEASADGLYEISLIATDTFNCKDTFSQNLIIDRFEADFITPDTGGQCSPAFISFEVTAAGADSFFWDFGDGHTLETTQMIASNLYDLQNADSLNNYYDVSLVAKSTSGCFDTIVKPGFINVIGPFVKFAYLNKIGCEPLEVQFADSNQSVLSFLFDYGDNSPISSNKVTSHIYTTRPNDSSTIYRPTIIATDNKGCVRQYTPDDSIVVYKQPTAGFTASATSGCAPLVVTFTNTSSEGQTYYWDFENDGIIDDSTENPVHAFEAGLHTVKLVVESQFGCRDSVIVPQLVSSYANPTARMDMDTTVVCFLADVIFYDVSSGATPLVQRWWDFGDTTLASDTSSKKNAVYNYIAPGFYAPTLVVEDANGCRDTQVFSFVEVVDTVPLPYSGLRYVSVSASNHVEVVWPDENIRGFKHYLIHREGPGGFQPLDTMADEARTQLLDTTANPRDGSICYDIQVQINCLTKSLAGNDHCTVWLQAKKGAERQVDLEWTPYQGWPQEAAYRVFRSDGGMFTEIALLNGTGTTYTDPNLCGMEYCYYVVAYHPLGYASASNRTCITPDYLRQETPLQLHRTTVQDNAVTLTQWERGEDANLSRYLVDRYSQNEGWVPSYATTEDNRFVDDQAQVHRQPYLYRVRMEDDCGESSPASNSGSSIHLSVTDQNDTFFLRWTAYREFLQGVEKYFVEKQQTDGSFKALAIVPPIDTVFATTDVDVFTTNGCYRITAEENQTGRISRSNIDCATLRSRMQVPSAFSPNNDSLNDRFYVYGIFLKETGLDEARDFELSIFNRWGEKIWTTRNLREGWDGTFKGQLVPEGVYFYTVSAIGVDQRPFYIKGTVTLRR
ncbi:MAG: PKD domain-containing protein [Bacteroidia bacterium]